MREFPGKPFTWNYSQPEEYHFSLDSVEAPWWLSQYFKSENWDQFSVLDLCAGCGVMGFELFFHRPEIKVDFVEVQETYIGHFQRNQEMVCRERNISAERFRFFLLNYEALVRRPEFHEQYDLILCNPPYFFREQGKMSPSSFKNRCRFFLDSDLENLVAAILYGLKDKGRAYVLVRDLQEHGKSLITNWRDLCQGRARVSVISKIRTASLLEISKL